MSYIQCITANLKCKLCKKNDPTKLSKEKRNMGNSIEASQKNGKPWGHP